MVSSRCCTQPDDVKAQELSRYTSVEKVAGCRDKLKVVVVEGGRQRESVSEVSKCYNTPEMVHLSFGPGGSLVAVIEQRDAIIFRSQRSF